MSYGTFKYFIPPAKSADACGRSLFLKQIETDSGYTLPSCGALPDRACCRDLKVCFTRGPLDWELIWMLNIKSFLTCISSRYSYMQSALPDRMLKFRPAQSLLGYVIREVRQKNLLLLKHCFKSEVK